MFITDSRNWKPAMASGQERLLIDLWLELVSDDATALYWPPLCSTLQLLRNLRQSLEDIERGLLREYNANDSAEELLVSLEDCAWLFASYPTDIEFLRERLRRLRDSHDGSDDDGKSHQTIQRETRQSVGSLLRAFVEKVERDEPVSRQVRHLCELATASARTNFDVLTRAAAELVNDLLHLGHSRDHLHSWFVGAIALNRDDRPYAEKLASIASLGRPLDGEFEAVFAVSVSDKVPASGPISFDESLPVDFRLPPNSGLTTISASRFALVKVRGVPDWRAAIEAGRRLLVRYLNSTRLYRFTFDRTISNHAAARHIPSNTTEETRGMRRLTERPLHNDTAFYELDPTTRNPETFTQLDRVVYWLEQSRRWDDVGRLIALWTAMEFLFSKSSTAAPASIAQLLPAYLAPTFARELLRDLWAYIEHAELKLSPEFEARLEVGAANRGRRRRVDLVQLLESCLEDDTTNSLRSHIKEYPILLRKYYRVRRLNPKLRLAGSSNPEICNDLNRFEQRILFEVRYAYRARNAVVHDAATDVIQIERLVQRLNWMVCTSLDTLLYQYTRNKTLSLTDLHEINDQSHVRWKSRLKDDATPVPLSEVVVPPRYGLAT
jgi:hypothetical protein